MRARVYLDWNATTPLRPEARAAMLAAYDLVGNPSSVHAEGREARRHLTDAIFPFYIVHQTAIIVIAHALRGSGFSAGIEASIVIAGTAVACVVTYEIARRISWLRPLFGLRMELGDPGRTMRQQLA